MNRPIRLFSLLILTLFTLVSALELDARDKFVVVIDPGHGGKDGGASHRKCKQDEKTIALNVALRLGKLIENNYSDVRVVYTRKTDVYPSLPDRVQKAKSSKGDLFISIHVNACPTAAARGFETYVFGVTDNNNSRLEERMVEERENLDINGRQINFDTDIDIETKILCQAQREKHNKQSLEVAKAVQSNLISSLKKTSYAKSVVNRGVMAKNLFVLCYSPMPAILVELGYMSNQAEERFINTDEAQSTFANAIYQGFRQYKKNWDKRQLNNHADSGSSTQPEPVQPDPVPEVAPQPQASVASTSTNKPAANNNRSEAKPAVMWRIQFLTHDRLLKDGAKEFKGLTGVTHYKEGKNYKYTYGNATSQAALRKDLQMVRKKFPDAFYVKVNAKGERVK